MRIVPLDYKLNYENPDIWMGFGLQHHSDVTHYYVHRKNESPTGSTAISKAMAEGVNLFASYLSMGALREMIKVYVSDRVLDESDRIVTVEMNKLLYVLPSGLHYTGRLHFKDQQTMTFDLAINRSADGDQQSSILVFEKDIIGTGTYDMERFKSKRKNYWLIAEYENSHLIDDDGNACTLKERGVEIDLLLPFRESSESPKERQVKKLVADYSMMQVFFFLLHAYQYVYFPEYRTLIEDYAKDPKPDLLVFLCENTYQIYKDLESKIRLLTSLDPILDPTIPLSEDPALQSLNQRVEIQEENRSKATEQGECNCSGDQYSPFGPKDFHFDYLELIPSLGEEFTMPVVLNSVIPAVRHGDARSVLFYGPAGTGKTIGCKLILEALKMPLMATINCSENLDEFVLGKYVPEGSKIRFHESYVTKAIRDGGAVVFEEINFSRPEYLAFLNSLLDDNGFVRLDNNELVRRHPNFRFFATMNIGYFGTKKMNQALYNRFNLVVELDDLSDEIIRKMLLTRVPSSKPNVDNMLKVYRKIRKMIEDDELNFVISPRDLENWARQSKYEHVVLAAEKTVIQVGKEDQEFQHAIKDLISIYRWT